MCHKLLTAGLLTPMLPADEDATHLVVKGIQPKATTAKDDLLFLLQCTSSAHRAQNTTFLPSASSTTSVSR